MCGFTTTRMCARIRATSCHGVWPSFVYARMCARERWGARNIAPWGIRVISPEHLRTRAHVLILTPHLLTQIRMDTGVRRRVSVPGAIIGRGLNPGARRVSNRRASRSRRVNASAIPSSVRSKPCNAPALPRLGQLCRLRPLERFTSASLLLALIATLTLQTPSIYRQHGAQASAYSAACRPLSQHAVERRALERVAELEVSVEHGVGFVATELLEAVGWTLRSMPVLRAPRLRL
jgi:hypothetical protein